MGVPEEDPTWLESEKQDGAEVGDVGGSEGCRRDDR